ncbi:class I adenylate-forming enzyme family protein [Nocardia sp. CA-120079]|uniref:class I adenylate-forming enzyme family protein n=1 Tax=Nocardia sp. CA-120079 TaxID=3239974 RepID=UPI003D99F895
MNLSVVLEMAAAGFGDRVVAGRRAHGFSAAQLLELSVGGARLVQSHDADAVVFLDVNGPAFPVALFAAARAGVPLVPLNYRLADEQLAKLLARHPGAVAIGRSAAQLDTRIGVRAWTAAEWLAACETEGGVEGAAEPADEAAVIIYTSGTTSEPKGALLSHQNLLSYVWGTVEFASAGAEEASLVSVPPYHIAAVANTITNLYAGRRTIVLDQFDGAQWLELVRAEGVTHALVVPTMLARIVGTDGDRSVPTLRSLAYGGASMPPQVIAEALTVWPHVDFVNAYGLTETSSTISVLGPQEHRAALDSGDPVVRARLGSAGRPVPSVEVEIRAEDGSALPAGVVGRIWVRGEQVSGRYVGSGSTLGVDGFFDTRDEGQLDSEGYLFVAGRADDTIIRGGENIAPAEIEQVILGHPDVLDVVVVGVPDPEWGQHLEAAVVAKPGHQVDPEELRTFVRQRLRGSKTPDRILVWADLPRTETGKIIRREALTQIQQDRRRSATTGTSLDSVR